MKFQKCNNGGWREEEDEVVFKNEFILNLLQLVLLIDETATLVAEEACVRH